MTQEITESEWKLLEVLWEKSPLSAREIYDVVYPEKEVHPQTVRTLLERLAEKGAVRRKQVHGVYVFHPEVRRRECVKNVGESFIKRFFSGRTEAGVAHFISEGEMQEEEILRLRKLLDQRMNEIKGK